VDELPSAVFASKDAGAAQSHIRGLLSGNSGSVPFYLDSVGKIRSLIPRYGFKSEGLAILVVGCRALHRSHDLRPPVRERTKRVAEGDIVASEASPDDFTFMPVTIIGSAGSTYGKIANSEIGLRD